MQNLTVLEPTARMVDPVTSPAWAELISSTASTLFHSPQWMRVLQETYHIPLSSCILERAGRPVAGVAWSPINDLLGPRRVTLPFSDFCDPLASSPQEGRTEGRTLAELVAVEGQPWVLRALARNLPDVPFPVTASTLYKWQSIELTPSTQELWDRLTSMASRGVRKAERSGVEVRQAIDKGELREWYLLHLRLRRAKFGLLAQPYAFFERIWDTFFEKGQGFLLLATHQDRVIGGTLYLIWKDVCYYKFSASDGGYLSLRPNNLVMWRGVLEAKERGCRLLDLGRSPVGEPGLVAFKQGFGAKDEDMYAVTYDKEGKAQENAREARRLLNDLTRLFVQESVPERVTEEAGALLYRFFT